MPLISGGYVRSVRLLVALGVSACVIVTGAAERVPAGGIPVGGTCRHSQLGFLRRLSSRLRQRREWRLQRFRAAARRAEWRRTTARSAGAPAVASRPRFSPDGTGILATVSEKPFADPVVAIVAVAGGRRDLVAGTDPSWSADGAEVALTPAGQQGEVWAIRTDGTGLRRIGSGSEPVWSPDGRFIAVRETGGAIAVLRPDRTLTAAGSRTAPTTTPSFGTPRGGDSLSSPETETKSALLMSRAASRAATRFRAGLSDRRAAAGGSIALRGGARLDVESGTISRAFAHWDILAVNRDWSRAAVSVAAGRYFAYEGNDLYVAEPLGAGARLVSPRCCPAVRRCLEGNDVANTLRATQSNSWLRGLAGHDSLTGSSGFDRIEGGFGDDLIVGGAGNDHLFGDVGRDRIFGGVGNDYVDGGAGDDVLVSGSGRGRIFAALGNRPNRRAARTQDDRLLRRRRRHRPSQHRRPGSPQRTANTSIQAPVSIAVLGERYWSGLPRATEAIRRRPNARRFHEVSGSPSSGRALADPVAGLRKAQRLVGDQCGQDSGEIAKRRQRRQLGRQPGEGKEQRAHTSRCLFRVPTLRSRNATCASRYTAAPPSIAAAGTVSRGLRRRRSSS